MVIMPIIPLIIAVIGFSVPIFHSPPHYSLSAESKETQEEEAVIEMVGEALEIE